MSMRDWVHIIYIYVHTEYAYCIYGYRYIHLILFQSTYFSSHHPLAVFLPLYLPHRSVFPSFPAVGYPRQWMAESIAQKAHQRLYLSRLLPQGTVTCVNILAWYRTWPPVSQFSVFGKAELGSLSAATRTSRASLASGAKQLFDPWHDISAL